MIQYRTVRWKKTRTTGYLSRAYTSRNTNPNKITQNRQFNNSRQIDIVSNLKTDCSENKCTQFVPFYCAQIGLLSLFQGIIFTIRHLARLQDMWTDRTQTSHYLFLTPTREFLLALMSGNLTLNTFAHGLHQFNARHNIQQAPSPRRALYSWSSNPPQRKDFIFVGKWWSFRIALYWFE